jgi:nucleotide-binding universal stress UspA family protein
MDDRADGAIVVGVTGRGRDSAALRLALECARREGADVLLVHAFHDSSVADPPGYALSHEQAAKIADTVVEEVSKEYEALAGTPSDHRAVALPGPPSRVLVELSAYARLVVVQHSRATALGRLFVGSTVNGAAAHAGCPVISVNEDWEPGTPPGEVVVGVHGGGGPVEVVEAGFTWAAATGAPVRIVHAWRLDTTYDAFVTDAEAARWREEQQDVLAAAVTDLRERHPQVTVSFDVPRRRAVDALVEASQHASLVVVGRHGSWAWTPERLGSLVRSVLREARSPVMVVPLRTEEEIAAAWEMNAEEDAPQT